MSAILRSLKDLSHHDLNNKRVFIRADFNVPFNEDGSISDDTRILAAIPTIIYCLERGAYVMVTSHLGRPKEGQQVQSNESLLPVVKHINNIINSKNIAGKTITGIEHLKNVVLVEDWLNQYSNANKDSINSRLTLEKNKLMVLENCRQYVGEKKNSSELAKNIVTTCGIDIFVNDAFGTAHRAEATTVGISNHVAVSCAGLLLTQEIEALTLALSNPKRPLIAIVGGSKVSTKLTILKNLADKVDQLIVGGGIANTFLLAKGFNVGHSLVEKEVIINSETNETMDLLAQSREIMEMMEKRGASVPLPIDVVCGKKFSIDEPAIVKNIEDIEADDCIFDVGPQTSELLKQNLENAQMIVWNGPVGVFEFPQFSHGTKSIADAISQSPAFSIAGGGDTVAASNQFNAKVGYISTGGGAFLEFLEGKTLPAVAALMD